MAIRFSYRLRRLAVRSGVYVPAKEILDRRWLRRRRTTNTFSQFGEDTDILSRLGSNGLYIDVGANHPFKASNTYLLYLSGWHGLVVEPIKSHCEQHRSTRPRDICLNAAAGRSASTGCFHELNPTGFSTFDTAAAASLVSERRAVPVGEYEVSVVPLAQAWNDAFGSRRPDFVSIDTEGFELEVLAGADLEQLAPKLVLLEFESAVDHGRRQKLIDVMGATGYRLVGEFGVNGLFERRVDAQASAAG